ncbi:TonB-dependent receptor family [Hyphomonas neptunium ATCC 15444]|uniref:TonB-dependent receptor family n=2 Tax=Hyphomonas TaxID=85 RepID=Q0C072_HYPNA|nr:MULTISPECIES: TonB-dependent receptor [Hyphomonas]ABI76687.1 TonB-dependent receptor family [Hyphomonas neptunium ATCC 15444]KCZ90548.1 TonB-dependent receptor family protein [Hyphomonas hirschiana VP5]
MKPVIWKTLVTQTAFCALAAAALAQEAPPSDQERVLETVIVTGNGSQVELPDAYAGGQVARGGRAGLLGNLDFLDAPFSGTAYTADLVSAQQSESVGDVLQNDPVVRVAKGFGNFQEVYVIRGFPVYSDDVTLNGVFGILPRQFVAAELLERVEVFRGANAFVNGAAPGGSGVGGSINLVPKRAPQDGIRRVTAGYESEGQAFGALDMGQRFGADEAWGARFNAVLRDGETSVTDQSRSLTALSLGTDYAGDRFRFTADVGYQDNRIDAPRPQVSPLAGVPEAPDADTNFAQPWTYTDEQQLFGVVRGEYDVTDAVTVWAAAGARQGEEANVLANPNAAADGSMTAYRFDNTREDEVFSADAGVRAEFPTGPIGHRVVVSATSTQLESKNAYAFSSFSASFATDLYNPVAAAPPAADFFIGGDLGDPLKTEAARTRSIAVADTLSFLDGRLLATLGLRHQEIETASYDYNSGAALSRYEDSKVTPAVGLVWKASDRMSLFGNYAESLQPGAIAPSTSGGTVILNAGEVLEPFTGEQMEAGIKYDSGSFGMTASVFQLTRPNAIVVDQVFQASGEQENQGVELTVFGEPVESVRLIGGLTLIDAEFSKTQGGVNEGNTVIGVPEVQANINAEWDVPGIEGLAVDGRVTYTGEQYVNETNTVDLDSWARLDFGVRYALQVAQQDVMLRARIENVSDEAYWASTGGFPGANYLILGNPRTFTVSASVDF